MTTAVRASEAASAAILAPANTRWLLLLVVSGGAVAGFVVGAGTDGSASAGAELARLLRAMAALKALLALALTAGVFWRLKDPVGPVWLGGYAAACGAMAAGPGLIWGMTHVGAGAAVLHAGLLAGLLLLWRDPVIGQRLATTIAARRALLRSR